MNRQQKILLVGLGSIAAYYYFSSNGGDNSDGGSNSPGLVMKLRAMIQGWQNIGSGPTWLPILNDAEQQYGLPQNVLAATAFQESSFDEDVIRGLTPSSDGLSLGIMQLQTRFYPSVNVPTPFTDADVTQQIQDAAQTFKTNYAALGSWPETIAAFNQGLQGVQDNGITSVKYVTNIVSNAPAANDGTVQFA